MDKLKSELRFYAYIALTSHNVFYSRPKEIISVKFV